jgi:hypothetical protein
MAVDIKKLKLEEEAARAEAKEAIRLNGPESRAAKEAILNALKVRQNREKAVSRAETFERFQEKRDQIRGIVKQMKKTTPAPREGFFGSVFKPKRRPTEV